MGYFKFVETEPLKTPFFSLNTGPEILRLNEANLNEMDEWSLFPVSNVCFFSFQLQSVGPLCKYTDIQIYNVMLISFSPKLML